MFFIRLLAVLILLATIVIGLGFLLADEWTVSKGALFDERPERMYEIVTDVERFPEWRSDVKRLQIERRGELWAWTEDLSSGTTLRVEEVVKKPNERYELKYESSRGIRGVWLVEFKPSGEDRTTLTITETVIVESPFVRLGAHTLMNLGALMDVYLGDLNRRAIQPDPSKAPAPKPTASAASDTTPATEVEPPVAVPSATRPTATPTPSGTVSNKTVPSGAVPSGTAPSATASPK